jgi:hypothetical protein
LRKLQLKDFLKLEFRSSAWGRYQVAVIKVEGGSTAMRQSSDRRSWLGFEVVTETGIWLGRVKAVIYEKGHPFALSISSASNWWIPKGLFSTAELGVEEVISSGSDRLIVSEGAEQRLCQTSVGYLERLGVVQPPWESSDSWVNAMLGSSSDADQSGWDDWHDGGSSASPCPAPRKPGPPPWAGEAELP